MTEPDLADLLGRPVRLHDVRLGAVTGVYCDPLLERVIGLEVSSPDGRRRFLPWVVASGDAEAVLVASSFLLIEVGELDSYLRLGARMERDRGALAGLAARPDGRVERPAAAESVSLTVEAGIRAA